VTHPAGLSPHQVTQIVGKGVVSGIDPPALAWGALTWLCKILH
jgi:hypothetical protein